MRVCRIIGGNPPTIEPEISKQHGVGHDQHHQHERDCSELQRRRVGPAQTDGSAPLWLRPRLADSSTFRETPRSWPDRCGRRLFAILGLKLELFEARSEPGERRKRVAGDEAI